MLESRWHVSSAVVIVDPNDWKEVLSRVEALDGVEVHGGDTSRMIITIEGHSTGHLGDRLTEINLMPGVLAANMVFEHVEDPEEREEPTCHST